MTARTLRRLWLYVFPLAAAALCAAPLAAAPVTVAFRGTVTDVTVADALRALASAAARLGAGVGRDVSAPPQQERSENPPAGAQADQPPAEPLGRRGKAMRIECLPDADLARSASLSLRLRLFDRLRAAVHAARHGRLAGPAELHALAMALTAQAADDR